MKPRDYQITAKNKVLSYVAENEGKHPLIALPTGSGKSLVIADIIKHVRKEWNIYVLVISHVREILIQDYEAINNYIDEDVGVYSAGLKRREILPVTVAGIQSIHNRPDEFDHFDFVIIDECHLISPNNETMYRKFLSKIHAIYFGLTATPFRLGTGYIYGNKDSLFDDLVYDLTRLTEFNNLLARGFLSNLIVKQTTLELDTEDLHTRGGDFIDSEMSSAFDKAAITELALDEVIEVGVDYKKWLIFAIDIGHAEHIAESLIGRGIPTGLIHSKMEFCRETTIKKFKEGEYRCIVNVNVLTTGFDDPEIDLIVMLRPTQSPVLHVQTVGRGLRPAPGKDHCRILDFAGNTKRLGPINDIQIHKKKKGDEKGEPITKTCPKCDTICHPTLLKCDVCGYIFPIKVHLTAHAGNDCIISEGEKWYKIQKVDYRLINRDSAPDMIRVEYRSGLKTIKEYWCLDHTGFARFKAVNTIRQRSNGILDKYLTSCESAMEIVNSLNIPEEIRLKESGKYPEITRFKF